MLIVTGNETGVGKTVVTAALAAIDPAVFEQEQANQEAS